MKRERDDTKGFEVLEGKNNEKRLKSSIMSKGKTLLIFYENMSCFQVVLLYITLSFSLLPHNHLITTMYYS